MLDRQSQPYGQLHWSRPRRYGAAEHNPKLVEYHFRRHHVPVQRASDHLPRVCFDGESVPSSLLELWALTVLVLDPDPHRVLWEALGIADLRYHVKRRVPEERVRVPIQ